eukprot:TRINITY_DN50743_c0_g1_i1.p1 TRINITY_DN50743_c0_g1~~TRINITY_DN50743_c0_g1_i1.p1  ORF type:complete len:354 (+),score=24.51 TRINITY_DN50743_c0_g1_i1:94-1155(+)
MVFDWFLEALFAEPSLAGIVGAGLAHGFLWGGYIGNWESGFMCSLRNAVRKWMPRTYYGAIADSYEGDPAVAIGYGEIGENEKGHVWLANVLTLLNHGAAGVLVLGGYLNQRPWLWRHGMLTQMAGMCIADLVKMLRCKVCPPGCFPHCNYVTNAVAPILSIHHSVSICAGLPCIVYFADREDFQWFGAMLSGGPLFTILPDLLSRMVGSEYRMTHAGSELVGCMILTYQRGIYFFPAVFSLIRQVVAHKDLPRWVKGLFSFAAANMTLFSIVAILLQWLGFFQHHVAKKPAEPEAEGARAKTTGRRTSLMYVPTNMACHFSAKKNTTTLFVTSRLVGKAHAAVKRVADKHER